MYKMCLLGEIGRHNRLKICRSLSMPVRVWQQAPLRLKMKKSYTQIELFNQPQVSPSPLPVKASPKPFTSGALTLLNATDARQNAIYNLRIQLGNALKKLNRTPSLADKQAFLTLLSLELKIKKGLTEAGTAGRSALMPTLQGRN